MNNILITGATGNTGSEVVKQLSEKGLSCNAMVRDKQRVKSIARVDWVEGSFDDTDSLISAFSGIERVYVAMPVHPDNELWWDNVITAARTSEIQHIVKLSGMGASEDAGSEIIRVHARTDKKIKASGIIYTLLQPNSFFQNIFNSIPTIKAYDAIYMSVGNAKQSFIDIRDIAAVAVKVLTESGHENKIYRLSGPEALSFDELARIIGDAIGKDVHYYPINDAQMKSGMIEAGLPEWGAEKISEIFNWFSRGGYEQVTTDVEEVLGRRPCSFTEFVDAHRDMFQ